MKSPYQYLSLLDMVHKHYVHCRHLHCHHGPKQVLHHTSLRVSSRTIDSLPSVAAIDPWTLPRSRWSDRPGNGIRLWPEKGNFQAAEPKGGKGFDLVWSAQLLWRHGLSHSIHPSKKSSKLRTCFLKNQIFLSPIWSDKSRKSKGQLRQSPPIECQSLCWWNALHAKWAPDPLDSRSPAKSRFSRWNCKEGATNLWLTNLVLHVLGDKEEEKFSKKTRTHTHIYSSYSKNRSGVVPFHWSLHGAPCHIPTWHPRRSTNSPTSQHDQRLVQQRLGGSRIASWAHEILGLEHHFYMHQMPISPLNLVFVVH